MKIDEDTPGFNKMQNVKRRFFALRNGVVADVYRKAGDAHRIIFGLSFVDIRQIAAATGPDAELSRLLHTNTSTRESRLLAPMIMPAEEFSQSEATTWLADVLTAEEADVLCNTLLRRVDCALSVAASQHARPEATSLQRYAALRMAAAVMYQKTREARAIADAELSMATDTLTTPLAKMIVEETDFILQK